MNNAWRDKKLSDLTPEDVDAVPSVYEVREYYCTDEDIERGWFRHPDTGKRYVVAKGRTFKWVVRHATRQTSFGATDNPVLLDTRGRPWCVAPALGEHPFRKIPVKL